MNQAAVNAITPIFCLQDSRQNIGDNLSFWGKDGGYTTDLAKAAFFSAKDALAQNASRPTDIPWPAEYLAKHSRPVVDMQYLNVIAARAYAKGPRTRYYVELEDRQFVGNDIVMVAEDRVSTTTNVNKAARLTKDDFEPSRHHWPVAYLATVSREAVDCNLVDIKVALKGTGITLTAVKPLRKEKYRCHGCGVFMTESDYYCSPCRRCDTDNRP